MGYFKQKQIEEESEFVPERKRTNANNRRRGKEYERRVAAALGGKRNLDKSLPHTDVETDTSVYEIKSTISPVPKWLLSAMRQCVLAAEESKKDMGGVIKVYTGGQGGASRAFLITEVDLHANKKEGEDPVRNEDSAEVHDG